MMNFFNQKKLILISLLSISCFGAMSTFAAPPKIEDFEALPELLSDQSTPLVMLAMSNDNQLWFKAYSDYSDLDGDGSLDTFYNDNFDYYGYFSTNFCYSYNQSGNLSAGIGQGVFTPNGAVDTGSHKCSSAAGEWSGNFLNWATMSRMDVVRKVLYGGLRVVDTATSGAGAGQTVLQRAFLPSDNHSFVKIVKESEIDGSISDYTPIAGQSVISFCNTTDYESGTSPIAKDLDVSTNPPLLKVAAGNFFAWSGGERSQCGFTVDNNSGDFRFSPPRGSLLGLAGPAHSRDELQVRVQVCVPGQDENECRAYSDSSGSTTYTTHKPAGLLQVHGETGEVKFGLLTGSYNNNDAGGVLRKNISNLGAGAAAGDQEVDMSSGIFVNQSDSDIGIVNTLNRLRIQGWRYSTTNYYDCDTYRILVPEFLNSTANNRQCMDWGNPLAEIYLETLRYFAGNTTPTAAFDTDDSVVLRGLNPVPWTDPMLPEDFCANCSIVMLSTGLNMFDGDDLGSASDLPNLVVDDQTNAVGDAEGISGGSHIIGRTSGAALGTCDSKTVTNLASANGICPEIPQLEGTYHVAGLAKYAREQDLRVAPSTGVDPFPEKQTVDTFTVSLAESLPSFQVETTSGNSISFVPSCRSNWGSDLNDGNWTDCSLVDLTVAEQREELRSGGETWRYGRLIISWEDAYWGNDNDMDGYSVIEYCTATSDEQNWCGNYSNLSSPPSWGNASTGEIQFRVSTVADAAGLSMIFGFVMNGSTADGPNFPVVRTGGNFYSGIVTPSPAPGENYIQWANGVDKFLSAPGTPGLLQNPLWYAAKYGNFKDLDGDGLPSSPLEYDALDLNGKSGSDGIPDNYFPVSNPAQLETRLNDVFSRIRTRISAGNSAAVISNTSSSQGALYQAVYRPSYLDRSSGKEVSWIGILNAFYLDKFGNVRHEGGVPNGILEDSDPIVDIYYDSSADKTVFDEYTYQTDGSAGIQLSGGEYKDLNPIWSAHHQLAAVADYTNQRTYSSKADQGRYIFTTIDSGDGFLQAGVSGNSLSTPDQVDFDSGTFDASLNNNFRYLGLDSTTQGESADLVNFIRGEEGLANSRSRTIEFDSSSPGEEPWLLGDIVHSTPVAVQSPSESYDVIYNDDTYKVYKAKYKNRRQMVYVGANDGMLHAFNGGFYDLATGSYKTDSGSATQHPLGSELWAYVPNNLLPHLQWLKDPNYSHVFYVDGTVQTYDVNIFPYDASNAANDVHPYGWGTILVVGFRFGGGDYTFDPDSDLDADITDDVTTRSAYVIFDITDPEQPPVVIAEITDAELGFTTSEPTVVKRRAPSGGGFATPALNDWFLVFGSGPAGTDSLSKVNALKNAESNQNAQVYTFNLDLQNLSLNKIPTTELSSFVGGFSTMDWNQDYQDDRIYFGTVGGTAGVATGSLQRASMSFSGANLNLSFSKVINAAQPFSGIPTLSISPSNDYWVYAGTGRFYVAADNTTAEQQSFYAVKETPNTSTVVDNATVNKSSLVNVSDVQVYDNGTLTGTLPSGVSSFTDMKSDVASASGWYRDFPADLSGATRGRVTGKAAISNKSLVFTVNSPSGQQCDPVGEAFLYAVDLEAGIPDVYAPLGVDNNAPKNSGGSLVNEAISLGQNVISDPIIITVTGSDGKQSDSVLTTDDKGGINQRKLNTAALAAIKQSWREIPITW